MNKILKETLLEARTAALRNIKPGIVLWGIVAICACVYTGCAPAREAFNRLTTLKAQIGLWLPFISYTLSAALFPEVLKVIIFQRCRIRWNNLTTAAFATIVFGLFGVLTDLFYHAMAQWFGASAEPTVIIKKIVLDLLTYTPFFNTLIFMAFLWRENHYSITHMRQNLSKQALLVKVFSVILCSWSVWIPGVLAIYSMPTALQLPTASVFLCFWALILNVISRD